MNLVCFVVVLFMGWIDAIAAISSSSATTTSTSSTTTPRSSSSSSNSSSTVGGAEQPSQTLIYGRISDEDYILTPEQIETFHREGCVTIENVLNESEVCELEQVFDRFISGEIPVPGKDFCDMSKPFGIPYEQWSIVNCMLPTTYYPPLRNNIYERLTKSMAQQLFSAKKKKTTTTNDDNNDDNDDDDYMVKDYDQFLNKRPGKGDAVFAWHQDMAYWPGPKTLGVSNTDTCTFSLAIDDSTVENGCLRYVAQSGWTKQLRPHRPLIQTKTNTKTNNDDDNNNNNKKKNDREEGHALTADVDDATEEICMAPAKRGSITIHDEYVVHGSAGNTCPDKQRRTYVLAYRAREIVEAERKLGFTHSHNDQVNWDTFLQEQQQQEQQQEQHKEESK